MTLEKITIETTEGVFTICEEYNEYFEHNAFGVNWESGEERHEWVVYDFDGERVGSFESAQFAEEYIGDNY